MKKLLLSMVAVAASTMVANADKVAFVAADNTYTGDANQVVVLPSGFDTNDLPLTSDAVMFSNFVKSSYVTSATFRIVAGANPTITPATGVTITGIKYMAQTTSNFGVFTGFTLSSDKLSQTSGTVAYTEATALANTKQARVTVIEVEYTGTPVKMPTISADHDYILSADKKVTLTAETGAKIYYTLDGTEPTEASTLYTEPFALEKTCYVRAIAVTDAGTSFAASKGYVSVPTVTSEQMATYNFVDLSSISAPGHTKINSIDPANALKTDDEEGWIVETTDGVPNGNYRYDLTSDIYFTTGDTKIYDFQSGGYKFMPRVYYSATFAGLTQYRMYPYNEVTYAVTDENYYLAGLVLVGGYNTGLGLVDDDDSSKTGIKYSDDNGTYKYETIYPGSTSSTSVWLPADGVKVSSVTLRADKTLSTTQTQFFQQIYVFYAPKDASGIEGVAVDNSNAPVEFYNLQGVRVANPTAGIYVKRQGNSATKVLVK
jgi:hypothetical protein